MKAISRILVAIKNPWARSLPAADKAFRLAGALGAEVRLFHALSEPVVVDVRDIQNLGNLERIRRERVLAQLTVLAKRLGGEITVTVAAEWDYPPHEAVIRAAHQFKASLIVAELHPASHRMPWLLRFTDFELLRLSAAPVLLVKTRTPYTHPVVLVALDPGHARAKPAGLDAQILHYGSAMTRALGGALHAVYAHNSRPASPGAAGDGSAGAADAFKKAHSQARAVLDRTVRSSVTRARRHLIAHHPVEAIDSVAREIGAQIVAMGAISRSGARRLVIGNTAEKLLDRLACDMLIVKPVDFSSRVPMTPRGAQMIAHSGVQTGY